MLHRLCGPPSIPLSFTLACVLPRRHAYRVSCGTPGCPGTPSVHRLRRGLPGYLILFASRAFEPQRQYVPSWLPSPSVFFLISTHSTATPGIPPASERLKNGSPVCRSGVRPRHCTDRLSLRLRSLYAPCFRTTLAPLVLPRLLARSLPVLPLEVHSTTPKRRLIPSRQWFTHRNASSHTWSCCVRVAPIAQYSLLLPPVGVWAVSQSQCGRSPSQAGYRSSPWWAVAPPTS